MRLLVCGLDDQGVSCIVSETELAFTPIPGLLGTGVSKLYGTDQSPPPSTPPGKGKFSGNNLKPGEVSWYVIKHPARAPGVEHAGTEIHYRDAVDMVHILEGGGDMMLGDGPHLVGPGDCILMPGSDHGLRVGAQGCTLMAFAVGTPPQT
jgi:mannose-6-phosphate isomerase-like protein (cupin superfamily)